MAKSKTTLELLERIVAVVETVGVRLVAAVEGRGPTDVAAVRELHRQLELATHDRDVAVGCIERLAESVGLKGAPTATTAFELELRMEAYRRICQAVGCSPDQSPSAVVDAVNTAQARVRKGDAIP